MSMGPLDLYDIGEAVSEALPEPTPKTSQPQPGEWLTVWDYPQERDADLGERVLSELQRRGWRLVREGERDG